jgi:mono/diheme cytochrome c family protein
MKCVSYLNLVLLIILAVSLSACGGGSASSGSAGGGSSSSQEAAPADPAGDAAAGKDVFVGTCSACHGPEGKGIPGLGKDMTTSEFIAGKTDAELVDFIKVGRDPSDPLNTTGVAMPPKGGNPALSDDDLFDVVAFIRTIHE